MKITFDSKIWDKWERIYIQITSILAIGMNLMASVGWRYYSDETWNVFFSIGSLVMLLVWIYLMAKAGKFITNGLKIGDKQKAGMKSLLSVKSLLLILVLCTTTGLTVGIFSHYSIKSNTAFMDDFQQQIEEDREAMNKRLTSRNEAKKTNTPNRNDSTESYTKLTHYDSYMGLSNDGYIVEEEIPLEKSLIRIDQSVEVENNVTFTIHSYKKINGSFMFNISAVNNGNHPAKSVFSMYFDLVDSEGRHFSNLAGTTVGALGLQPLMEEKGTMRFDVPESVEIKELWVYWTFLHDEQYYKSSYEVIALD